MNTADQTTWARAIVNFPVTMRTTPSLENPTAANYYLLGSAGVLSVTSISIDNIWYVLYHCSNKFLKYSIWCSGDVDVIVTIVLS
jgi:hypothetical protein